MASSQPYGYQHVLVLSFPQQSHVNPLFQISECLASRGLLITFALSNTDYSRILRAKQKPAAEASTMYRHSLNLRLVGVPDGLALASSDCPIPHNSLFEEQLQAMVNMKAGVELLIEKLQKEQSPITIILADVFVVWAYEVADRFGIRLAAFFTSNAISCSIFYHARSLKSSGILPFKDEEGNFIATEMVTCIPGTPPLYPTDFPACLTFPESHVRFRFILSQYNNLRNASAILMNTFEELDVEITAIAALQEIVPLFPIGPLLLLSGEDVVPTSLVSSYLPEQVHCLEWLDKRQVSSVLYASFGSVVALSPQQIKELAMGLEASQQPFLWVIHPDTFPGSLSDVLPEGFLTRTKDRGCIISWAPQLAVLAHPAVGAFLSHCGWNSLIENFCTGGVPILCWPLAAEQRLNCRIVVDYWKIGMEFRKDAENDIIEREEVTRVVKAMMEEEEGSQMRAKASNFKDMARKAAEKGGSSQLNMEAFVECLRMETPSSKGVEIAGDHT